MSAGLPGVGLSGTFFILSALLTLPLEVVRTLRGQSSFARWAVVLRHFATASAMIAGLVLCYGALHLVFTHLSRLLVHAHGALVSGHAVAGALPARAVPVLPVLATLGLVACVIGLAKGAELIFRASHRMPESSRT
jgi:hypothetical protein